jgi:hypothetical protein
MKRFQRQDAEEQIIKILEDHAEMTGGLADYVAGVIVHEVVCGFVEDERDAWFEYSFRKPTTVIH